MGEYAAEATELLRGTIHDYNGAGSGGSFSCSVYDTAWLAMVTKTVDGKEHWLFPTTFGYLLRNQESDGSWPSYASDVDGIMNTLAALLALHHHRDTHLQLGELMHLDIDSRIRRGERALQDRLLRWDVGTALNVGFEVLVPGLLRLAEAFGSRFDFPGKRLLFEAYEHKMSCFDPTTLYQDRPTSALHSLEAFIGRVDFDRLKHHTVGGSMMGSPSSTAAYLQHSTVWDAESEDYLHRVLLYAEGKGSGGVPSAYPTANFEMIWVTMALLQGGFTADDLDHTQLEILAACLESSMRLGNGLVAFAPGLVPDADDTSQAIKVLRLLGKPTPIQPMIAEFEAPDHFKTYAFERDPSFSANCNVLISLLSDENQLGEHRMHIQKTIAFLRDTWWNSDQKILDKWVRNTMSSRTLFRPRG
ncbi:MAG: hypothetical protein Q9180_002063 [Flavoplaca navasiana]